MVGRGVVFLFALLIALHAVTAEDITLGPDERLSILAANMLVLAEGDYRLDCGPVAPDDSVLTTTTDGIVGDRYCVMDDDGAIIVGTAFPAASETVGGEIEDFLPVLKHPVFAQHIDAARLPKLDAICASVRIDAEGFTACEDITTKDNTPLHLYLYYDQAGSTAYVLVSQETIDAIEPSLWSNILGFFQGIFGDDADTNAFISQGEFVPFHHGYFARFGGENGKSVTATWHDDEATIIYQGFYTDLNGILPRSITIDGASQDLLATYALGHDERQVITIDTTSDDAYSDLWRKLTVGFMVDPDYDTGTPVGDTCGNKIRGYGEDCDQAGASFTPARNCHILGDYVAGNLACDIATCAYDTSDCVSCADDDDDGYYNNTGVQGKLVVRKQPTLVFPLQHINENLRSLNDPSIAFLYPFTADDAFNLTAASLDKSQAYQLFLQILNKAKQAETACPATDAACQENAYAIAIDDVIAIQTAQAMGNGIWHAPQKTRCTIKESKVDCPQGYSLTASGVEDPAAAFAAAQGLPAVVELSLAGCTGCGIFNRTGPASEVASFGTLHKGKIRLYCGLAAMSVESQFPVRAFIVKGKSADIPLTTLSDDQYATAYTACKNGIEDALGPGVTVLADPIVSPMASAEGEYAPPVLSGNGYAAATEAAIKKPGISYVSAPMASAPISLFGAILSLKGEAAGLILPTSNITNATVAAYWNATLLPYKLSSQLPLPEGIIGLADVPPADSATDATIILWNTKDTEANLPAIAGCTPKTYKVLDTTGLKTSATAPKLPGYGAVIITSAKDCFADSLSDKCGTISAFDCDDGDASVHPGTPEICGNDMDDDCDTATTDTAGCVDPGDATTTGCNYDNDCGADESATCRDCLDPITACPSGLVDTTTNGKYKVSVRAGFNNEATLIITTANWSCSLTEGTSSTMQLQLGPAIGTTTIFKDGSASVKVTTTADAWEIANIGTSTKQKGCWGADTIQITKEKADVPICLPGTTCQSATKPCVFDTDCCNWDAEDRYGYCATTTSGSVCRIQRSGGGPGGRDQQAI